MPRFLSYMNFQLLVCLGLAPSLCASTASSPEMQSPPFFQQNFEGTYQDHRGTKPSVWSTDYKSALQQAQRENKALLLFFTGSDWCAWCKRLEQEVLDCPECISGLSPYFVFVKLNYPRSNASLPREMVEQNTALKRQYGVSAFPTVLIVNAQEQVLGKTGYDQVGPSRFNKTVLSMLHSQ